jgi:hypothetical protein
MRRRFILIGVMLMMAVSMTVYAQQVCTTNATYVTSSGGGNCVNVPADQCYPTPGYMQTPCASCTQPTITGTASCMYDQPPGQPYSSCSVGSANVVTSYTGPPYIEDDCGSCTPVTTSENQPVVIQCNSGG